MAVLGCLRSKIRFGQSFVIEERGHAVTGRAEAALWFKCDGRGLPGVIVWSDGQSGSEDQAAVYTPRETFLKAFSRSSVWLTMVRKLAAEVW